MNETNFSQDNLDQTNEFAQDKPIRPGKKWFVVLIVIIAVLIIAGIVVVVLFKSKAPSTPKQKVEDKKPEYVRPVRQGEIKLVADKSNVEMGEIFIVEIQMDTQGTNTNVADVVIIFDTESLELVEIDESESDFTMAAIKDTQTPGQVQIVRGTPSDGNYLDSDDGFTGVGRVASLEFKALENGETTISFNQEMTKLFLDDRHATEMVLSFSDVSISVE